MRVETFDAWKAQPGRPTLAALLGVVQGRVLAICRGVLQHPQEAEEAAQETLLKIVSGIEGVGDAEHFERWVGQVAERTALDRRRHSRCRKAWDLVGASRSSRATDAAEGLNDAIARLPEDERDLIVERYFERRTFDDMARRRRVSDVAVRKRLEKAHGRLRRILGSVVGVGVAVMKAKAAAIAVVIIPLLVLSGGVIVASVRRPAKAPTATPEQPKGSAKIASFLADSKPAPAAPISEPQRTAIDRAQIRAQVITNLERLRYVGRRSWECKELWPEASTEEEGRALQREKVALDKEWGELHKRIADLAAQDPGNIVEMVTTARELPDRLRLMGMIAPDVDSEIVSETAPSGPLLKGLMTLAIGDAEEKMHLAAFAGSLSRGNRELAQALMGFMNDSDLNVRINGALALAHLSDRGALRGFLAEQAAGLKQAALRNDAMFDYVNRGCALRMLASLGTDDADDFILQQFESLDSRHDFDRLTAADMAAKRLVARHEARFVMAIQRAFDLSFQDHIYLGLVQLMEHVPNDRRAGLNAIASDRRPPPRDLAWSGRSVRGVAWNRPVYRSYTSPSRHIPQSDDLAAPGAPGIRPRR